MPEFMVQLQVQGRTSMTVKADTLADAKQMVEDMVNAEDWDTDLEDIDDVNFTVDELIPIMRDGRRLKTTYVRVGDVRIEE